MTDIIASVTYFSQSEPGSAYPFCQRHAYVIFPQPHNEGVEFVAHPFHPYYSRVDNLVALVWPRVICRPGIFDVKNMATIYFADEQGHCYEIAHREFETAEDPTANEAFIWAAKVLRKYEPIEIPQVFLAETEWR